MRYAFVDYDGTLVRLATDHAGYKAELGVKYLSEVPKDRYETVSLYEMAASSKAVLMPEAKRFLEVLKSNGFKVVIVSRTGKAVIEEGFRKFEFPTPYLRLARDDVAFMKPDIRHVTNSVHDIDKDSIVVGDDRNDFALASALGLKYYQSVSEAMKGLGFRKPLHSDEVWHNEVAFLWTYCKSPILDVGCGSRNAGDVSIDPVNKTADYQAEATKLPFKDDSFESVLFIHSLEHVEDFWKALREAKRVLHSTGKIGIVIPTVDMSYYDPTHKHHWTTEGLTDCVLSEGYALIAIKHFETIFDGAPKLFSHAMVFGRCR